jgi:TPR repeat protein
MKKLTTLLLSVLISLSAYGEGRKSAEVQKTVTPYLSFATVDGNDKKNLWENDPIVDGKNSNVEGTRMPASLIKKMDIMYKASVAKKDCVKNNNPQACYAAGLYFLNNLSLQDGALKFLTKACNLEHKEACVIKGIMHLDGFLVKKNIDTAGFYFTNNCLPGSFVTGCVKLGHFYQIKKKYFESSDTYNEICFSQKVELDRGEACQSLGFNYANGFGVRHNIQKAKELFGLACDYKNNLGCYNYKLINEQ